MKQVVGLYIISLTFGQKHRQIKVMLYGHYGQWAEPGFVPIYGITTHLQWTRSDSYFTSLSFNLRFVQSSLCTDIKVSFYAHCCTQFKPP